MKKIVKLTESDLIRLVKRVILEQDVRQNRQYCRVKLGEDATANGQTIPNMYQYGDAAAQWNLLISSRLLVDESSWTTPITAPLPTVPTKVQMKVDENNTLTNGLENKIRTACGTGFSGGDWGGTLIEIQPIKRMISTRYIPQKGGGF